MTSLYGSLIGSHLLNFKHRYYRDSPIRIYNLGPNTIHCLKANPIEEAVLIGAMSDRSIFVLDTRQKTPLKKVSSSLFPTHFFRLLWNFVQMLLVGIQSNLSHLLWLMRIISKIVVDRKNSFSVYTFDMRYLSHPKFCHQGHTAAVTDIDYSPTGQEFVSGSFDRTVRIFNATESRSRFAFYFPNRNLYRDVYHTKRMSNVLSVLWSMDNKFILSGSNEMNIRVWKAKAAEKLGPVRIIQLLITTYFSWHRVKRLLLNIVKSWERNSRNILKLEELPSTDKCRRVS